MAEGLVTVKEYANNHGVTIQAVYQQINRKKNKKFIQEHIHKINGIKYLDEDAVKYLENQRVNTPAVIMQTDDRERVEQLENENKRLLQKIAELQDVIIEKSEKIEQLQDANILLLEQKQDDMKKKPWWMLWK